jgi:hypothetical protein
MTDTTAPHCAIITFDIKIHQKLSDGSLHPTIMTMDEMREHGITTKASMKVEGFNQKKCIENLKEKLEKLNE